MHQEAYQDAGHCHQDGVVVHTLQPYGEGREMNLSGRFCGRASGPAGTTVLSHYFLYSR